MDITGRNPELRIVLVGNTGSGKSASGNTILGRKEFKSEARSYSVTNFCQRRDGEVAGRSVFVVDTPDLLDSDKPQAEIKLHAKECASLSAPGPHALLLTIQLGRFTEEEKRAMEKIQQVFVPEVTRHTIVLFTRGDDLEDGTIEDFVQKNEHLSRLVKKCGGRYHLFNNRRMNDRTQVTELLEKIERMVAENGASWCEINLQREDIRRKRENQNVVLIIAVLGGALGAGVGAALGASIGAAVGTKATGATVGAVIGGLVGVFLGIILRPKVCAKITHAV